MRDHLLHHLLERSAQTCPERVAATCRGETLTYSALHRMSDAVALGLRQRGVKPGDRVGIALNKSLEGLVSLFAILKAGAAYVPVDPSAPVGRIRYILRHCGVECLFITGPHWSALTSEAEGGDLPVKRAIVVGTSSDETRLSCPVETISFDVLAEDAEGAFEPLPMSDGNPAYILHTSGSTGNPKGVAISHLNALTFVKMAADFFGITSSDRIASHAPLHFDLSVFDIFVAVRCGATVVLLPELLSTFPVKLAECVEKERITVWNSVSSVLKLLADKGKLEQCRLDSLRIVHFSGDLMPVKYLRVLKGHMKNAVFFNIYGQTEANSSMCYRIGEIPDDDSWRIPIGRPFPNFEVFALDDQGNTISRTGDEGELYVSSSTVALGYWGEESMTREKFVGDPRCRSVTRAAYRTGDLVRLDENGDYVFTGRKDHMVKSRGYRVELEEIESVLASHPEVVTAIVIPIPDDAIGNRIAAVIVAGSSSLKREDISRHCLARLPHYMMPEIIEFRDSLPHTSSGKVDRKNLAAALVAR